MTVNIIIIAYIVCTCKLTKIADRAEVRNGRPKISNKLYKTNLLLKLSM